MIYLKEGKTPLNLAYNDEIVHEGNSKYQLSFKFPTNNSIWEDLTEETLLLADDLQDEQEFIIFEIVKNHGYITVYANQIATLLNNYSITELSVKNASGDRVMNALVSSIRRDHTFTFYSDIANTHSINLKNTTVANALFKGKHSILGQWGGDLIRDKYSIKLLNNGGSTKEVLFMYKKNLKSYHQKKSIKDLRTRIHFTKTITAQNENEKDRVIAVTVDSPLIHKYKNIYEDNLEVTTQDVIDEATLRKYGENYFRTTLCDVLEESIEIDVVGNPEEKIGIFDTVTIFHEKFNLDVKKKITKYMYSPMGKKLKTIGFGKIQSNLGSTLSNLVDEAVSEHVESQLDAFKIQKNLAELLKSDKKAIEDKMADLEEKSKAAVEVKKALFEADGTIPNVVKTKILDAVEADISRLKTIITEAEMVKAIQAQLNYAEIKNALIDKAFINQIISDEKFTQQFEDGEVNTQNIFTKLKDSIKSNISKEFVTKDGVKKLVNDLTIDAEGIRQITQQESEKVFEKKKTELKGTNSYIHKKYSDYPEGRNMSDNSTLKYIGIYTGDKEQAPTNASEYSWTKIKSDGKLYKAYSNSLNGLDFTLVDIDEDAKLFAKNRPRVNIVNNNDISDIWQASMFLSFKPNTKYTLTARAKGNSNKLWAYFRNNRTSEEYSWGQLEFRGLETKSITFTTTNDVDDVLFKFVLLPEDEDWTGIQVDWFTIYEGDKRYTDYPVNEPAQFHKYRYFGYVFKEGTPVASDFDWFDVQQKSITSDKYTHIVYSDNADGSNFGSAPKKYMGVARTTSPTQPTDKTAYKWFKVTGEDGHNLTADLRFEGRYIDSITTDVKVYLDVFYDGQKVNNGFDVKLKEKGGTRNDWSDFWNSNVDNGLLSINNNWKNGTQNGQPLELIALVTYKGLTTVANARLENIPDIAEIKETIRKYKTFESTLDRFNSTIGEVKEQVLSNEGKRNLILGSRMLSSSDYSKIGNVITLTNYVDYEGMNCLALNVSGQSSKIWNGVGFDLSIPRMNKGDKLSLRLPIFINNHQRPDDGVFVAIKNHDTGEFIWRERLDNDNSAFGHWSIKEYHFTISKDVALTKNSFMIYHNKNGHISFVMPFLCYGDTLPKKYSPAPEDVNLQNSRIETSIKQTKDQIDLKVSKDNVIASINASVERTGNGNQGVVKIKADKVDIAGVLSAYAGNIGGFRIGPIDKYPGKYITGDNQFSVGMSNGNTKSPGGAALWVNWGKDWNKFPATGWVVEHNGKMHAYNGASFKNGVSVTGPMYVEVNGGEFYYKGNKLSDLLNQKMNMTNIQIVERKQDASGPYVVFYSTAGNTFVRTSNWSDKRLKSNIAEAKVDALDAINQLNVYEYDFKKDDTEYHKSIGLIAQEIKEHLPDAHESFGGLESYNPFFFIPYLVKSIQQLSAENEKLNKKIEELEGKINGKL